MGKCGFRVLAFILSLILILMLFSGCSGNKETKEETKGDNESLKTSSQSSQIAESSKSDEPEPLTLPIVKEPLTLTYFIQMDDAKIGATVKSYAEMTCYKEIEKRTGIHIDFQHPPSGQATEQFNLMLASRELPDMIYWGWLSVPGGPQKAIDDGVILPLNDLINKYAPNLKKFLDQEPEIRKDVITDEGNLYVFPIIRYKQSILAPYGFQLRKDWLDKLNLQVPTTIDEWYNVLKTFKEKDPNGNGKADEIPFVCLPITNGRGLRDFLGAWGLGYGFYQVDGKVKYGPIEPEYKEAITVLRQWYKEGLIDPDFASTDPKQHDAKVTSGLAGSWYGGLGDTMGRYIAALKDKDPSFQPIGAPAPSLKKGEVGYNFRADSIYGGAGAAISTKTQHPKEAVKWQDYKYSDEGHMIINFGIEGLTYNMVNGYPKLADDILNNPQGLSVDVALGRHAQGASGEAQILDARVREQRMWNWPVQKEASMIWNKGDFSRKMPAITPTGEESQRIATIMSDINTYVAEMFNKFIMGQEPIENYEKYVSSLKDMGIEEAINIQQAALDRYNARK